MHGAVVVHLPHAVVRGHVHVHDGLGVGDQARRGDQHAAGPRSFSTRAADGVDRLGVRHVARIEGAAESDLATASPPAPFTSTMAMRAAILGQPPGGGLADAARSSGDHCNALLRHETFLLVIPGSRVSELSGTQRDILIDRGASVDHPSPEIKAARCAACKTAAAGTTLRPKLARDLGGTHDEVPPEPTAAIRAEDIDPRYNWGRALPALGTMGVDFEERVDYRRLHRYRLARARQALEKSDLGALLVMDVNNIRYLTSTKIGEWERDKICRWALLTRGSADPILWDFGSAAVHHRLYAPWLKPENCKAGLLGLRGTVSPPSA